MVEDLISYLVRRVVQSDQNDLRNGSDECPMTSDFACVASAIYMASC